MNENRPDWLSRNGGRLLLVFGVALVAIAVAIADKQVVASVLAFSGVGAAIFAVLLTRLEGSFKFSPAKFAATLKAAREVGVREDLTLEERADLILRVLGVGGEDQTGTVIIDPIVIDARGQPSDDVSIAEEPPLLPRPLSFTVPGATDEVHRVAQAFEHHVERLFRESGWDVEEVQRAGDGAFDFAAQKDRRLLYVEVKLHRRLTMADARQFLAMVLMRDDSPATHYVYAVNAGALSAAARNVLATDRRVVVWEVVAERW